MVTVIYEPTRACVQRESLGSRRLRAGLPCSFGCDQGLPSSVPSSLCPWGSTLLLSSRSPPRPATQSWPCFLSKSKPPSVSSEFELLSHFPTSSQASLQLIFHNQSNSFSMGDLMVSLPFVAFHWMVIKTVTRTFHSAHHNTL